jgi:hypothetical protein
VSVNVHCDFLAVAVMSIEGLLTGRFSSEGWKYVPGPVQKVSGTGRRRREGREYRDGKLEVPLIFSTFSMTCKRKDC